VENFLCAPAALRDRRWAMSWQVYVLRCGDGTLYTGIARDALQRLAQHEAGKGARYTRGRGPLSLVLLEPAATHGDALRREAAIKRLGRAGKEALVSSAAARAKATGRKAKGTKRSRAGAGS
jgi:putative endonuclease